MGASRQEGGLSGPGAHCRISSRISAPKDRRAASGHGSSAATSGPKEAQALLCPQRADVHCRRSRPNRRSRPYPRPAGNHHIRYCSSQGKEILLDHTQSMECMLHGGCGEANVTFLCLSHGDPQLQRPILRSEPNLEIEFDKNHF